MNKLKLSVEELMVESFTVPEENQPERGSVEARMRPTAPYCKTVLTYDCCTP